jgi:cytochrome c oxidase subunit IV
MAHEESHAEHYHPSWKEYKWVALILFLITVVEVWVYYIPELVQSKAFVPGLLIMSAIKFAIVVMYYMHLKYDHKLFRALFTGPLLEDRDSPLRRRLRSPAPRRANAGSHERGRLRSGAARVGLSYRDRRAVSVHADRVRRHSGDRQIPLSETAARCSTCR